VYTVYISCIYTICANIYIYKYYIRDMWNYSYKSCFFLRYIGFPKIRVPPKSSKIGAFLYSNKHVDLGTPRDLRNPRIAHYKTYPCSMPLNSIKSQFFHGECPIKVISMEKSWEWYQKLHETISDIFRSIDWYIYVCVCV
jgi:hypothetical protein